MRLTRRWSRGQSDSVAFMLIFLFFAIILLNGFAAGVAAFLYLRYRHWYRGRRNFIAVAATGAIVALMFTGVAIFAPGSVSEAGLVVSFILIIFGGGGAVLSLPGAIAMSRMVERGPSVGDTFD